MNNNNNTTCATYCAGHTCAKWMCVCMWSVFTKFLISFICCLVVDLFASWFFFSSFCTSFSHSFSQWLNIVRMSVCMHMLFVLHQSNNNKTEHRISINKPKWLHGLLLFVCLHHLEKVKYINKCDVRAHEPEANNNKLNGRQTEQNICR